MNSGDVLVRTKEESSVITILNSLYGPEDTVQKKTDSIRISI